jgi:translation initiation factor eIF-2B subunit alpha
MMDESTKIDLTLENKSSISSITTNSELSILSLTQSFKEYLEEGDRDEENTNLTTKSNVIDAYIKTISNFIEQSQETTLQGLNIAIKRATEYLFRKIKEEDLIPKGRSVLSLQAVSEIMINMINKHISKKLREDFSSIKKNIVTITKDLYLLSTYAKEKISNFFNWVIKNGMTILVHGYSSTILYALIKSKNKGISFKVLVTESRPENDGELMAKVLSEHGIESQVILDISIGYHMKDIDFIVIGADAVCENGGVINKIGTFTIALCAKNFKKPFYVMVESLKFLKMYPLDQCDVPQCFSKFKVKDNLEYDYNMCDYTPPEFTTLLFTDIGIFTPSAVSDELIQMFYN